MLIKRLIAANTVLLVLYALFSVLRTSSYLASHLTSAPHWVNYLGLGFECLLIAATLVIFFLMRSRIPATPLPTALSVLRVIGIAVIIELGIKLGASSLAGASPNATGVTEASRLPFILAAVFHKLLYIGLWLMVTECLRLFIKNKA